MKYNISALSHKKKGQKHWNYKGDGAGYKAFHLRVQAVRGVAKVCEKCSSTKSVEWANLSGKYEDVNDYQALCRRCHHKQDGRNFRRATTLGKENLSKIAEKGWITRRLGVVSR